MRIKRLELDGSTIYINLLGNIDEGFAGLVTESLVNAYRALGGAPSLVEVYVYESSELRDRCIKERAAWLGVIALGFYDVSHEAWEGWPRIHVVQSSLRALEPRVVKALLLHEAAHSVLHGSLASYVVNIDLNSALALGVDPLILAYLASVVVKDLEVHKYLVDRGLSMHVEVYFEHFKSSLKTIECRDVTSLLELAKLLTPCVLVSCPGLEEHLTDTCRARLSDVLEVLRELLGVKGDLSSRIKAVILALQRVVHERGSRA